MKPINKHKGKVAPLDMVNVDTDQIIPKQFLKRIERTGFGKYLFYDWRFKEDGSFFIKGNLLDEYGFEIIIAPSFADIFYNNCFQNGLLPIKLDKEIVKDIIKKSEKENDFKLNIDLESQMIWDDTEEISVKFDIEEFRKYCLLNGLDDIGLTLNAEKKIQSFENKRTKIGGVVTDK